MEPLPAHLDIVRDAAEVLCCDPTGWLENYRKSKGLRGKLVKNEAGEV
jgi:hypothetical protein